MPFNSFNFWLIFPFIFILYWSIPNQYKLIKKLYLLFISLFLYILWKPSFVLILLFVIFVTYVGALLHVKEGNNNKHVLRFCFILLGISPLLIFKYYNFINNSVADLLIACGLKFSLPGLNWAIPIGISFFTFQAIGYLIDVYRNRITAEKNFLDYALFISFFPQVISGPISTGKELLPQIKDQHKFNYEQAKQGLKFLLWGMFIKLVVADRLGLFVDTIYGNYEHYSGFMCFIASIFYTIQIYGDFAGYSYMAIGIARTLGFDLINNFQRPYFARSVTEFWKRWHISLTRWLTKYVYIELGGNRCSKFRQYTNIMVTFLVSGLWHGANWTFVIWGVIHGFLQIIEKALYGNKIKDEIKKPNNILSVSNLIRMFVTFFCINIAWIFFRMPSINDSFNILLKMFTFKGDWNFINVMGESSALFALTGLLILLFKDFKDEFLSRKLQFLYLKPFRWTTAIFLFIFILLCGILDSGQFIYVSF